MRTNLSFIGQAGVLSVAIVAGTVAMAASDDEGRHGPRHMSFAQLDGDGDGQITRDELQAAVTARMASADTDGDGFLSQAELEAQGTRRAKRRAEHMLERMDENGDGKLALAEIKPRRSPGRMFDRIDADDSGTISAEEYEAAHDRMRKWRGWKSKD